jgi:transposase
MPKSLSDDLRERVIEAVQAGASRREAAERFEISASSAVKWLQRWRDHGVCAPKPRGGSRSILEDYAERILALIDEQPDRTLVGGSLDRSDGCFRAVMMSVRSYSTSCTLPAVQPERRLA